MIQWPQLWFIGCQIIYILFPMVQKTFGQSLNFLWNNIHWKDASYAWNWLLTFCTVFRSDNFIVGLTNVSPLVTAPTLWNYTVCGQHLGAVGAGANISLACPCGLPAYRYVIIQFPTTDYANFVEVEVYVHSKFLIPRSAVIMLCLTTYLREQKQNQDHEDKLSKPVIKSSVSVSLLQSQSCHIVASGIEMRDLQ